MNPKLMFPMAIAALVHIGLGQNQGESSTNTKFFTGDSNLNNLLIGGAAGVGATLLGQTLLNQNNNNGCRRRRQAQSDTKFLGSLFPSNNNCYNPCGRRKRQTDNNTNTKLFGLFGGNNNNCGGGSYYNRCQCSGLSKTDNYGREEARCARPDHTGRRWCYSTSSSNCYDAQRSSRYPNNPWSYNACGNSG